MIGETEAGGQVLSAEGRRAPAAMLEEAGTGRSSVSILLVLDRPEEAARICEALSCCRDTAFIVDHVSEKDEARHRWRAGLHDIVICDMWMGRRSGVDLMVALAEEAASRPVVVLSNLPTREARTIMGAGSDFLVHSKENLSTSALAMTLCSALALARRMAVTLYA